MPLPHPFFQRDGRISTVQFQFCTSKQQPQMKLPIFALSTSYPQFFSLEISHFPLKLSTLILLTMIIKLFILALLWKLSPHGSMLLYYSVLSALISV
ncbi:unnamed protein product [Trifolium pratense]|uniref:Uncharacterized protein n=1 Tax=Trifolium pratense TaxID=57577 RepID=A0ACB0LKU8_TRIPR|nr:unnamed protein product [Trifolium pratense]